MAQDGEILRSVAFANAAVLFSKGDIQNPTHAVFDAPVSANGLAKLSGITGQACEETVQNLGVIW